MSQRRMFSPQIVESDEFISMPVSSQALYFHLGMNADDDGFIQPKIVMRSTGANDDDLKVLLTKRFLLPFQSGVVVIKHWLIHNLIQKDRYHPTRFQEEKKALFIKENKAYTEVSSESVNKMLPEVRLGKGRLDTSEAELRIVDESEKPQREKKDTSYRVVFELWGDYPLQWKANRTEIAAAKNLLVESSLEDMQWFLGLYEKYKRDPFCPTILKPSDMDRKWDNLLAFKKKYEQAKR